MTQIKQGDLVTVQLSENSTASNVYSVHRKLDGECVLSHPLYPQCLIIRPDTELNLVAASLKNSTEKCLEFVMKNRTFLDHNSVCDVLAMAAYFVINRKLSSRQLKVLAGYCGKIASIILDNNLGSATKKVADNAALLDEYNLVWFNNLRDIYSGKKTPSPNQRESVFNQAGFILAQLETNIVPQRG